MPRGKAARNITAAEGGSGGKKRKDESAAAEGGSGGSRKRAPNKMLSKLAQERQRDEKRVRKFREELTSGTSALNREISAQCARVIRELTADDANYAREQTMFKRIQAEHQTLINAFQTRTRQLKDDDGPVEKLIVELGGLISKLQNDMTTMQAQRERKSQYFTKHTEELIRLQQATFKLREATFRQLDELFRNPVSVPAAQPWTLPGHNGLYATSQAVDPIFPSERNTNLSETVREAKVIKKPALVSAPLPDDDDDDEQMFDIDGEDGAAAAVAAAADSLVIPAVPDGEDKNKVEDRELRRRERANAEPPPAGFATDSTSHIMFLLARLRQKLDDAQRTDVTPLPPM